MKFLAFTSVAAQLFRAPDAIKLRGDSGGKSFHDKMKCGKQSPIVIKYNFWPEMFVLCQRSTDALCASLEAI